MIHVKVRKDLAEDWDCSENEAETCIKVMLIIGLSILLYNQFADYNDLSKIDPPTNSLFFSYRNFSAVKLVIPSFSSNSMSLSNFPELSNLISQHPFTVDFMTSDSKTGTHEGKNAGLILRWIIQNYDSLSNGAIQKVIFHPLYPNKQDKEMTNQINKLFKTTYFLGNDFGDIYPEFVEHNIRPNGKSSRAYIGKRDFLPIIHQLTQGTSFQNFPQMNGQKKWKSGHLHQFFVRNTIITNHPLSDYKRMFGNLQKMITNEFEEDFANSAIERAWQVLFTNCNYPCLKVQVPPEWN